LLSGGRLAAATPDSQLHTRTRSRTARTLRALLVVFIVLGAGACRVRTEVGVAVKEDGSGTLTVRIGLDDDALKQAPNFQESLKIDDLRKAGWTITGPAKETDGFTYITAVKPFANPDEASQVFAELSGDKGPFRNFKITRERSFARTKFTFDGVVDFSGGLDSFGDSQLASELDGKPVGDDVKAIEARINDSLDNVFQFRVAVRFPGDVTSNAPGQAANGAVWEPRLSQGEPVDLKASSESVRWPTVIGTIVAVLAAIALLAILVVRTVLRVRRRGAATLS
jgi:hypothetical protein